MKRNRPHKKIGPTPDRVKLFQRQDQDTLTPAGAEQVALLQPWRLRELPLETQRIAVGAFMMTGTPISIIADYLGMSEQLTRKTFARELKIGEQMMLARIGNSLMNTALYDGDARARTAAAIFIMKARGGWKEDGSTAINAPPPESAVDLSKLKPNEQKMFQVFLTKITINNPGLKSPALIEGH